MSTFSPHTLLPQEKSVQVHESSLPTQDAIERNARWGYQIYKQVHSRV